MAQELLVLSWLREGEIWQTAGWPGEKHSRDLSHPVRQVSESKDILLNGVILKLVMI
jgi:hypothetical protein